MVPLWVHSAPLHLGFVLGRLVAVREEISVEENKCTIVRHLAANTAEVKLKSVKVVGCREFETRAPIREHLQK